MSVKVFVTIPLLGDLLGDPSPGVLQVESDGKYGDRITLRLESGGRLLVSANELRRAIDAAEMGNL
jgi:hypothetical protein